MCECFGNLRPNKMTFLRVVNPEIQVTVHPIGFGKTIYYRYDTTSKIKATLPHKASLFSIIILK